MGEGKNEEAADAAGHYEGDVDGCTSDIALEEHEITDDAELPPASGGVEPAAG